MKRTRVLGFFALSAQIACLWVLPGNGVLGAESEDLSPSVVATSPTRTPSPQTPSTDPSLLSVPVTLPLNSVPVQSLTEMNAHDGDLLRLGESGKWETQSLSGLTYRGLWDARVGTFPEEASSGDYYIVSHAGETMSETRGRESWAVGDWLVFGGKGWEKLRAGSSVISVNGQTGPVTLKLGDLHQVSRGDTAFNENSLLLWDNSLKTFRLDSIEKNMRQASRQITADQINTGTISLDHLPAGISLMGSSVDSGELENGAVQLAHIQNESLGNNSLAAGAITAAKLSPTDKIPAEALANGSITGTLIAPGAVTASHLAGGISTSQIQDGAVTATQVPDGSLGARALALPLPASTFAGGQVDDTELSYVSGATSNIQTQINTKGTVASITAGTGLTGGAITATGTLAADTGTTAGKVLQLDNSGNIPVLGGSLSGASSITVAGQVKLQDQNTPAHEIALKAPANLAAPVTYELPASPQNGRFLTTDGNGVLSFQVPSSAGDMAKAVYDTNNDQEVDSAALADEVPLLGGQAGAYYEALSNYSSGQLSLNRLGSGLTPSLTSSEWNNLQGLTGGNLQAQIDAKGTVSSVATGTGLTGGPITTTGTVAVDVGTGAHKILQLNGSGALPAVDGSQVTNLPGSQVAGTASSATSAVNFSGNLAGDVTGTQGTTSVGKIRGRTVANTAPSTGDVLTWNGTSSQWEPSPEATGVGEVNTMANVGTGVGVYKSKSGVSFEVRSVDAADSKVSLTQSGNHILVDVAEGNINLSSLTVTGGVVALADGGTGATTAAGARSNLGLGSVATQNANAVALTGGSLNGVTIGDTTPAAGTFTTLNVSGALGATSFAYSSSARNCGGGAASTSYNGHCYSLFKNEGYWNMALATCTAWGGHLPIIADSAENTVVKNLAASAGTAPSYVWLGGTDILKSNQWLWWPTLTAMPATNSSEWSAVPAANRCTTLNVSTGKWTGQNCSSSYAIICESY